MAIEPEMSPPDWGRFIIPPGTQAPVGNPIRWGGVALTRMDPPEGADSFGAVRFNSASIVNAAAGDGYARSWSIVGTLRVPRYHIYSTYVPPAPTINAGSYPFVAVGGLNVLLEVILGVGQISFTQTILLMAGGSPTLGLCNTQAAANGGPYGELHYEDPVTGDHFLTRPFAAVGAINAGTISIRGAFELGGVAAKRVYPMTLIVGIAPYAAGEKL